MRAALVAVAAIAVASCGDANTTPKVSECPEGVKFGACDQGAVCTEWGYPTSRFAEIAKPGPLSCATLGGTWSETPCPSDDKAGGCLTNGPDTCTITWLSSGASDSQQGMQLCQRLLGGRWITSADSPH